MPTLWLMEDQLSIELVRQHRPDRVLLIESKKHFAAWDFHKHRIAFQLSAIRHFVEELRAAGITVHHYGLDRRPYLDSHQRDRSSHQGDWRFPARGDRSF